MGELYAQLFARRCRAALGHLAQGKASRSLNMTCYMLWDMAGLHPRPDVPSERAIDDACFDVLRRALTMRHLAVQESGLHGLSHWHRTHRDRVVEVVDQFIALNRSAPPVLLAYARSAKEGHVP